jgi:hypothetical protein
MGDSGMDSSMMGKIVKAKRYAEQRDRVRFDSFRVTIKGDHDSHVVTYSQEGGWSCDCGFFAKRGVCSHTMAVERILDEMIEPVEATLREPKPAA